MKENKSMLKNEGFQSVFAALVCIVAGLLIGYIVLAIINPAEATEAMLDIIRNFANYPRASAKMKYLGNTLVKVAPLLMCALSVNFCYKTGLFNIGAAGQYVVGAAASLYGALAWHMPWYVCILMAMAAGMIWGSLVGLLKAYGNVNEVISGIMLNWIALYLTNMLLGTVSEAATPYTTQIKSVNTDALIPDLGMRSLFINRYVTLAIPFSVIIAIAVWVVLTKTKFGYELCATGFNKNAAKYSGMNEKRNVIMSLMIGGALAAVGASFLYLSGYEQWQTTQSAVPAMGFNGIAATFLGGLNPIGTIFASYFIQHITSGGAYLDTNIYPSQIADLITAIIIYLCGFVLFFKHLMNTKRASKGGKN